MKTVKTGSRILLSFFLIVAGVMHFVASGFYRAIMPPYLPWHLELVYLSGMIEIALGILLLIPQFRTLAAWGVVALLIAIVPANIHVYQHQELIPAPPLLHLLRLPMQGIFILWAYWHTRQ